MNTLFTKKSIGAVIGMISIFALFFLASYLTQTYEEEIKLFVQTDGNIGMFIYIIFTATAVVVAPISTLPLIPLASMLWGWLIAALLSIVGWVLGSQIAFLLARTYGKPLIEKITSLEKIKSFENTFSKKNIFWFVVFLRMTVPVDVLSYAIGIFSNMKAAPYFLATFIGVTPFAFIFAYTGTLSIGTQIITLAEIGILLFLLYLYKKNLHVT